MILDKVQVQKIAALARIQLSEEQVEKFRKDLSAILDYVEQLNVVNTEGIEPTSQVTGLTNMTRKDEVRETLAWEKIEKTMPETRNRHLKVQGIFE